MHCYVVVYLLYNSESATCCWSCVPDSLSLIRVRKTYLAHISFVTTAYSSTHNSHLKPIIQTF